MAVTRTRASTDGELGSAAQRDRRSGSWTRRWHLPPRAATTRCRCGPLPSGPTFALGHAVYRYFLPRSTCWWRRCRVSFSRTLERLGQDGDPWRDTYERNGLRAAPHHEDDAARADADRGDDQERLDVRRPECRGRGQCAMRAADGRTIFTKAMHGRASPPPMTRLSPG